MKLIFSNLLLLVVNCCFSQNSHNQYKFAELSHGLSSPYIPNKPYTFKTSKITDSIPATLNTVFGIEFRIKGVSIPDLHYTREWVFPTPMKEDGIKYGSEKITKSIDTNLDQYCYFSFDKPYQLLKGTWKLNIYIEKKLMFTRSFIVY